MTDKQWSLLLTYLWLYLMLLTISAIDSAVQVCEWARALGQAAAQ